MIKKYRIKLGKTQEEMAEFLDLSPRQYQRIEANAENTKIKVLKEIIKKLNINDSDIINFMKDRNNENKNLR